MVLPIHRGSWRMAGARPGPAATWNVFSVIFAVLLVLSVAVALLLTHSNP